MKAVRGFTLLVLCRLLGAWGYVPRLAPYRVQPTLRLRSSSPQSKRWEEHLYYHPPDYLLRIVDSAPNNKLSVSDVIVKSGNPFPAVQRDLMALATATQAGLEVTQRGDILFSFPTNVRSVLLKRSWLRRLGQLFTRLRQALAFVFRMLTGLTVLASLTMVVVGLAALGGANVETDASAESSSSRSKDKDKDKEREKKANHHFRPSPRYHHVVTIDLSHLPRLFARMNVAEFLEASHSFVFGDGGITQREVQDKMWSRVATIIAHNQGVVAADQVAAYLPHAPPCQGTEDVNVNEAWMIPVMLRFGGSPLVTPSGHIAYRFEEWTADSSASRKEDSPVSPQALSNSSAIPTEEPLVFSRREWKRPAMLGGANLLGVTLLGRVLTPSSPSPSLLPMHTFLSQVYPFLKGYAWMFLLLPVLRALHLHLLANPRIAQRNAHRANWMHRLQSPDSALRDKLHEVSQEKKRSGLPIG